MKRYMFQTVPLSIIRSSSLYMQQWYMSYRFADSLRAGAGWNCSILILLASCQQTCMTYTIAACTVKNSWWWTDELSEHVAFHPKNKFWKLVHLVGFIIRYLSWCMVTWMSKSKSMHETYASFYFIIRRSQDSMVGTGTRLRGARSGFHILV